MQSPCRKACNHTKFGKMFSIDLLLPTKVNPKPFSRHN